MKKLANRAIKNAMDPVPGQKPNTVSNANTLEMVHFAYQNVLPRNTTITVNANCAMIIALMAAKVRKIILDRMVVTVARKQS